MKTNARTSTRLSLSSVAAVCLLTFGPLIVAAQQSTGEQSAAQAEPIVERDQTGRVSVKLPRGVKIALGNRTTGRIIVTGWDRDTIEAKAMSDHRVEYVRTEVSTNASGTSILIKADYAEEGNLLAHLALMESRRPESDSPFQQDVRPGEIDLDVKLPRHAEIELIRVMRSDVEITGVETHIAVSGERSTIKLSRVASVEVRNKSGAVEIEKVSGLVDVITTSGTIRVREAGSDVRALSIGGQIEVQCARGRVNVGNTDGPVILSGIGGDVDATTTNSEVRFTGAIREQGRYYLKSMSGPVLMSLRPNPAGFIATLSSYRGTVEPAFPMKILQSTTNDPTNRRVVGRHGNGHAQIILDSFDGTVRLSPAEQSPVICP